MAQLSGKQLEINALKERIRVLEWHQKQLIKALEPFASFGPDLVGMKDNQAFMGAGGIKAGHFKTAYMVYQELNSVKKNEADELQKSF